MLNVYNEGGGPLTISALSSDVPGVSFDPTAATVEAGAALAIEVRYEAADADPRAGALTITSDDPDQPALTIPLTANAPGIGIGEPAAAFSLIDTEGRAWSETSLEGKVALLAYFATW